MEFEKRKIPRKLKKLCKKDLKKKGVKAIIINANYSGYTIQQL